MSPTKHLATLVAAVTAVLLVAAAAGFNGPAGLTAGDAEARIKPPPRLADRDRGRIYHDECIVLGGKVQSPWSECVYGDPGSDTHVVLYGDSHALQWGPAMIRLANANGWRLTALVRQGCPIAQVRYEPTCDTWRSKTMRRIVQRERPDLIVVSVSTTARNRLEIRGRQLSREQSQPHLRRGMMLTLARLRNTGARVVVIRDQVRAQKHPPTCVRRNYRRPNRACGFRPTGRRERHGFDYEAARRVAKVRVIDPMPKLCPRGFCPVVKGGILVYRDTYHFTATYARAIAPWLGRNLPPAKKWR